MNVSRLAIPEVLLIEPKRFEDERGWFQESYNKASLAGFLDNLEFIQDNHVKSLQRFTLRGLHFQKPPHAQAKLVRCLAGALFDVAVDIRHGSPTFGQWVGEVLSGETGNQIYVPVGFAHGYLTLTEDCEVAYKVTAPYAADLEGGLNFADPSIAIAWPGQESGQALRPIINTRDLELPNLRDLVADFVY